MLRMILGLANTALWLFDMLVLAWVILSLVKPGANRWTVLVSRLVEPVLTPVRGFLNAKLPAKWQILDWSPLAVWIVSGLLQRFISLLRG